MLGRVFSRCGKRVRCLQRRQDTFARTQLFQRLQSHKFWQSSNCILVSMAGVPTRATRRFIRKLSDESRIPVYAFVDCDPYGISNIYRTLKVGSGNAAHLSQFFCVPQARYLGVTPQDIDD